MRPILTMGVDLAGSPKRPTGICLLRALKAQTAIAYGDEEILELVAETGPGIIAIDAPLTLPPGRKSIDDINGSHFRPCDMELRRRGIRFFPITLGPMRLLTVRGMKLKSEFEKMGYRVIEIYPGGALDVWGIPRQHQDRAALRRGLLRLGVTGLGSRLSGDELDAATAALVGRLFLQGKAEVLGNWTEGAIVMPRPSAARGGSHFLP